MGTFIPNGGMGFPLMTNGNTVLSYKEGICTLLKQEFGRLRNGAKLAAQAACGSEEAVKKWLSGRNAPSGEQLLDLMAGSPAVYQGVLAMVAARQRARGFKPHQPVHGPPAQVDRSGSGRSWLADPTDEEEQGMRAELKVLHAWMGRLLHEEEGVVCCADAGAQHGTVLVERRGTGANTAWLRRSTDG